jgi:hypothetical protein
MAEEDRPTCGTILRVKRKANADPLDALGRLLSHQSLAVKLRHAADSQWSASERREVTGKTQRHLVHKSLSSPASLLSLSKLTLSLPPRAR